MAKSVAGDRLAERKLRDREARRAQIVGAARRIAELEGWANVTVRRLSEEISYSQPVLYGHFGSRDGIVSAVAVEGIWRAWGGFGKGKAAGEGVGGGCGGISRVCGEVAGVV